MPGGRIDPPAIGTYVSPEEHLERCTYAPRVVHRESSGSEPVPTSAPPTSFSRRIPSFALAAWLIAVGLALVAPFLAVTTLRVNGQVGSIDGWGRDPFRILGAGGGVNFGVLLWLWALAMVIVMVVAVRSIQGASVVAAAVAPALVLGLVAAMSVTCLFYTRGVKHHLATSGPPIPPTWDLHAGACLWLTWATAVASAVGSWLYLRAGRPLRPT
jgi:hypothetical protein